MLKKANKGENMKDEIIEEKDADVYGNERVTKMEVWKTIQSDEKILDANIMYTMGDWRINLYPKTESTKHFGMGRSITREYHSVPRARSVHTREGFNEFVDLVCEGLSKCLSSENVSRQDIEAKVTEILKAGMNITDEAIGKWDDDIVEDVNTRD